MRKVMALLRSVPADLPAGRHALDVELDGGRALLSLWVDGGAALAPWPAGASAWDVEERLQWDDTAGDAGVKQVSFVRRLPALGHDEFAAHWSGTHAPLARRHHPGLRRYVQNVVLGPLTDDTPEVDGIAELTFASAGDHRDRFYDSDEGRAAVGEDVRRFIDRATTTGFVAREVVTAR